MRLAVGVSGGADSVALLRTLAAQAAELGLVLSVVHMNHQIRGAEADADAIFVKNLAANLRLDFHTCSINVPKEAAQTSEGIEEAARRLRYQWFEKLMAAGLTDAVATAHTLDDQAETLLAKLLRGAWTEGLGGIHPVVGLSAGWILRPLLRVRRTEIEQYLKSIGQPWREDASNLDTAYTRNRIRHELLPLLATYNPRISEHLAGMATLARDEEEWWQDVVDRQLPQLLLEGLPVRGGGRAGGDNQIAMDVTRLRPLAPALLRRILRAAAKRKGVELDLFHTEALCELARKGRAGSKLDLGNGVLAERTARELRLLSIAPERVPESAVALPIPGKVVAFGCEWLSETDVSEGEPAALIRPWRNGDRVMLCYSRGPRKVKEVLERVKISGSDRAGWPVVEWQGKIVAMEGIELEPVPGLRILCSPLKPKE
jgi:tRNA(Ile)-lysidine synthase